VDWDRLPTARRITKQDRLLVRYLREEVHPFSATEAGRLDGAGLAGGKLRGADDLARLAPVDPSGVDGLEAVLRPTAAGLSGSPDRFRWWWATVTGRRATFIDEEIDPRFRTLHFDDHGPLLVASSAADLDRLADLGRRALGMAGVRRDDAVVTLLPARGDLVFWTVALGCRRSGVAALHLGAAASGGEVAGYAPSVLVGSAASLGRVAAEEPEVAATVALVLAAERLDATARAELADRYPGAAVRALWSPPGVRAPWVECTHGRLHTWPDAEVVQTVDGEVVWTPLGWRGTVVLRLRTGIRARIVDQPCRCGATSPRLELLEGPVAEGVDDDGRADLAALALQRGERRNRRVDHGVMADDALADAFFAEDPAAALATYTADAAPEVDTAPEDAETAPDPNADADADTDTDDDAVGADDPAEVVAERPAGPDRSRRRSGGRRREADVPAEVVAERPVAPDRSGDEARLAAILDREDRIGAWVAEVGPDHLVVWLAPVIGERTALEADLPRLGAAVGAGRLVVERPSVVRRRLEAAGGARVVDRP
jgi:hypothetical protein